MATYIQTKAIVLGHRDLGEADRLYTVLTEARGKLEVRVRGARKITSKLVPPLSSMAVVKVLIYEGRARPLLLGVEMIERFSALATSLWRSQMAARFLRLADLATRIESRDPELFSLLRDALHTVNQVDREHASTLRDAFILQLLSHIGYHPELDVCVQCRAGETSAFSIVHGGSLCSSCSRDDLSAVKVTYAEIDSLRSHLHAPLAFSPLLPRADLGNFTRSMLRYRLETALWFPQ